MNINQGGRSKPYWVLALSVCRVSTREAAQRAKCHASAMSEAKSGGRPLPMDVQRSLCRQLASGIHLLDVEIPHDRLRALAQTIYDEQQAALAAKESNGAEADAEGR